MEKYNIWYAVIHEIILDALDMWPALKRSPWIGKVLDWTKPDWVFWRAEQTIMEVSEQAKQIMEAWEKEEPKPYEVIEHQPDGSKAQELLGGTMEIRSTWRRN